MKIIIFDEYASLDLLAKDNSHIKLEDEPTHPYEVTELGRKVVDPFVLLWHRDAGSGLAFLCKLPWPANLRGCVFYSSQPNANMPRDNTLLNEFKEHMARVSDKANLIHFLGPGVPHKLDPIEHPEIWRKLHGFCDYVSKLDDLSAVAFLSLQVPAPESTARYERRLKERVSELALENGHTIRFRQPVPLTCPVCSQRADVHHSLQRILKTPATSSSESLALLDGESGKELRRVLDGAEQEIKSLVTKLLKQVGIRGQNNSQAARFTERVYKAFGTCAILNPNRANQIREVLHNIEKLRTKPIKLQKLIPQLEKSLHCPCQTDHQVEL